MNHNQSNFFCIQSVYPLPHLAHFPLCMMKMVQLESQSQAPDEENSWGPPELSPSAILRKEAILITWKSENISTSTYFPIQSMILINL